MTRHSLWRFIMVLQLREEFDSSQDVRLNEEHNPHDVAALLKEYFRDLPDPLLTRDLYAAFIATRSKSNTLATCWMFRFVHRNFVRRSYVVWYLLIHRHLLRCSFVSFDSCLAWDEIVYSCWKETLRHNPHLDSASFWSCKLVPTLIIINTMYMTH